MEKNGNQLLQALITHQQSLLETSHEQTLLHEKWRDDYIALRNRLKSLSDKLEQPALLPLGPKAFAHGKIIHTNEIMCLLGDNWFMECTSKQAIEIVERRIKKCNETLNKLKKEVSLREAWEDATRQQLVEGTNEHVREIMEEYDEEKETEWKKIHREKVRNYHKELAAKRKEPAEETSIKNLWSRLDELELEEDEELNAPRDTKPVFRNAKTPSLPQVKPPPQATPAASAPHVRAVKDVIVESSGSSKVVPTKPTEKKRVSKFKKSREQGDWS